MSTSLPPAPVLPPDISWELLDRYFAGQASTEEEQVVQAALTRDARLGGVVEQFASLVRAPASATSVDVSHMLTQVKARNATAERRGVTVPTDAPSALHDRGAKTAVSRSVAFVRSNWPRRAGMFAAALGVLWLVGPGVRQLQQLRVRSAPPEALKEFRTAAGQRARITLPDSSTVVLAPKSYLRYAANFGTSSSRTVMLEGQALFSVTHSAGAPFIVQTGDVATRVLGTSFTVRRYTGDGAMRVVVAQGRVAVGPSLLGTGAAASSRNGGSEPAVLTTGDVATLADGEPMTIDRATDVAAQLAWTEGRLLFAGVPLRDVIPEFERWYDVTIEVTDSALLRKPVMTVLDTEPIARAAELVAFAVGGRAELRGRRLRIHSH